MCRQLPISLNALVSASHIWYNLHDGSDGTSRWPAHLILHRGSGAGVGGRETLTGVAGSLAMRHQLAWAGGGNDRGYY